MSSVLAPGPAAQPWITHHHRLQFQTDGYVVVRNVVPRCLTVNAARDIAAFIGADLGNQATWYGGAEELGGIVSLHHAQSMWDVRQCPSLYQVFTEFFETPDLLLDINRGIFCPPATPRLPAISRGAIHWDSDPRAAVAPSLQAVVLLTDVLARNSGGFQCLPKVYRSLDAWLQRYARRDDFDFFEPGLKRCRTTQVKGRAGDVILWSSRLPHGTAANFSKRPRIAMFVTMQPPADPASQGESLTNWWLTRRAPDEWRGLPGQLDPEPGSPAVLSELGLKLIGARPW